MRQLRRALAALIATCAVAALTAAPPAAAAEVEVVVTPNRPGAAYLYGQSIVLTASAEPAAGHDHWHWFIKEPRDAKYEVSRLSEGAELRLPHSMTWDGAQVYAELYGEGHDVVGRSDVVTLHVDRLPAATDLVASADRASYRVGDTAALSSTQDPPTGEDHFHWYLRREGEEYFTWIEGTSEATATLPIDATHAGAEVMVRLFDHDHVILAESEPIRLRVARAEARVTTRVLNAPVTVRERPRVGIRIAAPVRPAGTLEVRVDGRQRVSAPAARSVVLRLPRLAEGRHRLRVVYGGSNELEKAVVTRAIKVVPRR